MESVRLDGLFSESQANLRVDKALAEIFPQYSRAKLSEWLKNGSIHIDGVPCMPKNKIKGTESVQIRAEVTIRDVSSAQEMPLDILFEDEHILVLNKPANLVVHPAAGHHDHTLLNGLLHHAPELACLPRAGIVHRLDKDTTGVMVVAKSLEAHHSLVKQLQDRTVSRCYVALVHRAMISGGTIQTFMGRHPSARLKMAVLREGKEAVTHYRVKERFTDFTLLDIRLETGRTHQIRVHMSHSGYPIVGDQLYCGRLRLPKGCTEAFRQYLGGFKRQALHAYSLEFIHPISQELVSFQADIPEDMNEMMAEIRKL